METVQIATGSDSCCPSLSLKTRVIGFLILLSLGIFFAILTAGSFFSLITGNFKSFVIFYTISVGCLIGSSFFLKGPAAQWKTITDKKRLIPSIIFLITFIGVFLCAYLLTGALSQILCLVLLIIQIAASIFYLMSFVPYGKEFCLKCCKSCFTCEDDEKSESII